MIRTTLYRRFAAALLALTLALASGNVALAQPGLLEALNEMDKNENGYIEPKEITPLARPYFEYISRAGSPGQRIGLDGPIEISRFREAARRFYATKNGASGNRDIEPEAIVTVKPFGIERGKPLVPEFGLAKVTYPYTQDDIDFVARTMRTHDENKDGFIDREEASRHKWTHRNPFDDDLNLDDRISRLELAQRYARRRLLDRDKNDLVRKAWRTGSEARPKKPEEQKRTDRSQWWRTGGSDYWLTASLMGRFDKNNDRVLTQGEYEKIGVSVGLIDADRDGEVTRDELFAYVKDRQDAVGGSDPGVPAWFDELDKNRDGQVAMPEFAEEWTHEKLAEFERFDLNGDGLLTTMEVVKSKSSARRVFENLSVELMTPRKTSISEIVVEEDITIADLDVQVSITHTNDSSLDGFLIGPDGQRIELFTAVGGQDDNFDLTVFDDQAEEGITKARPPFKGSYQPEGLLKKQPSLGHFNGQNAKGVWQLIIRGTRSDRHGLLHGWSLMIEQSAT